mgnify:CR=1 FL=1
MKKSLLNLALISALGISFSGCIGGSTPVNLYQPIKEEITLNNSQLGAVDKGAIILKNGSKILPIISLGTPGPVSLIAKQIKYSECWVIAISICL